MDIIKALKITEIVISFILVIFVVLQPKDQDSGTLFGGGFTNEVKRTRRGVELFLHNATIVFAIFWAAIAIGLMLI